MVAIIMATSGSMFNLAANILIAFIEPIADPSIHILAIRSCLPIPTHKIKKMINDTYGIRSKFVHG